MDSIEATVREYLSAEARSSTGRPSEIQSFCETVEESSLNLKVHEALALRKQGHFDKAMLNITEANRDQMIAIREIQRLMARVAGERYPEVVFEKFRQFEPFEIGLADADPVLSILAELDERDGSQIGDRRSKLHEYELQKKNEGDYLAFMEERSSHDSAPEEAHATRESLGSLARKLTELRNWFLERILVVVDDVVGAMPSGIEKDRMIMELARNMLLVVTSPILTKPATQVEIEE